MGTELGLTIAANAIAVAFGTGIMVARVNAISRDLVRAVERIEGQEKRLVTLEAEHRMNHRVGR